MIFLLFLLSGTTSLIYQMVWLRFAQNSLGASSWAVACILVAYMGGLGLGAWSAPRWRLLTKHPLRSYGFLEGLIGLYGLISPFLFQLLDGIYVALFPLLGATSGVLILGKFLLAELILLFPTWCMGATLPLLAQYAEGKGKLLGRRTGILYGINTLGASLGCGGATFFLIPQYGFRATLHWAALLNGVIFVGALLLPSWIGEKEKPHIRGKAEPFWLAISFFMGCASLSLEVLWTRILSFYTGSNVYAYGWMLFFYLLGLGLGALFVAYGLPRISHIQATVIESLSLLSLLVALTIGQFRFGLTFMEKAATFFPSNNTGYFLSLGVMNLWILFLPTLFLGLLFPLYIHLYLSRREESGVQVGKLYGANTLGAIFGTLVTSFFALSLGGTTRTLGFWAWVFSLLAYIIARHYKKKSWWTLSLSGILLIGMIFVPKDYPFRFSGVFQASQAKVLKMEEDASGVAMVVDRGWKSLEINGVNVAGTSEELLLIQALQGHLPLLLHPGAKKVLHIGVGSGGIAYAVSTHPVETIQIAEISKVVVSLAKTHFKEVHHGVFQDPRLSITLMDGRNYVLGTHETYDLILSDSIHPKYAGNGFLYTKDYFSMVGEKLNSGGFASMWLPMYSLTTKNFLEILRAFYEVFPLTLVFYPSQTLNSYTIVIGSATTQTIDVPSFIRELHREKVAESLHQVGIDRPEDLLATCILGPKEVDQLVRAVQPHQDDHPTVEYESNRLLDKNRAWLANFHLIINHMHFPQEVFRGLEKLPFWEEAWSQQRVRMLKHRDFLYEKVGF